MSHTYATLEVPAEVYDLVAAKLVAAEYHHAFVEARHAVSLGQDNGAIDMHGIALTRGEPQTKQRVENHGVWAGQE